MKRTVILENAPKRIVSLVPSQTELLHALGLEDQVIGITKFCVHPEEWFHEKARVGGTKSVSLEKVRALQPDLILGNKEENERKDIEQLEREFPVWMSDIFNLNDALEMIADIGALTGTQSKTQAMIAEIEAAFYQLTSSIENAELKGKSVAYFIWNDPMFCAGKNTFIDAMIASMGLVNYCSDERYPEFKSEGNSPDFIFLSSEPFPFNETHLIEFQSRFSDAKVVIVDGEMFSWYGSRLRFAPDYFLKLGEQLAAN